MPADLMHRFDAQFSNLLKHFYMFTITFSSLQIYSHLVAHSGAEINFVKSKSTKSQIQFH